MLSTSCVCGAVRLEVDERPQSLVECNCSVCRRYGARWAYYPSSALKITADGDRLQRYHRHGGLAFVHCVTCGCVSFFEPVARASDAVRIGVNMRMIDDPSTLAGLAVIRLDGAANWTAIEAGPLQPGGW